MQFPSVPRRPLMTRNKSKSGLTAGYGKPPLHTRFQAGHSGNPAGRPKGSRNLRSDVRQTLQSPVKVNDQGKARRISTQQAALMRLREKALLGDAGSLDRLLEYARAFNNDIETTAAEEPRAVEDEAIL